MILFISSYCKIQNEFPALCALGCRRRTGSMLSRSCLLYSMFTVFCHRRRGPSPTLRAVLWRPSEERGATAAWVPHPAPPWPNPPTPAASAWGGRPGGSNTEAQWLAQGRRDAMLFFCTHAQTNTHIYIVYSINMHPMLLRNHFHCTIKQEGIQLAHAHVSTCMQDGTHVQTNTHRDVLYPKPNHIIRDAVYRI